MKNFKVQQVYITVVMLILGIWLITGCGGGNANDNVQLIDANSDSVNPGTCTVAGPKVSSSSITDGAAGVSTSTIGSSGKLITVNFSEAMKPDTVTTTLTFTLAKRTSGIRVNGATTMNSANTIATFTTNQALETDTVYTATITKAAENASGTSLSCSYRWSFTTATTAYAGHASVNLGTAGTYGIFANAAAIALGTDSTAILAQTDIQAAYDEASIRTTGACAFSNPSDISAAQTVCDSYTPGPTYKPGLYRASDSIGLAGTITLDAQGDASAVFIFQTDAALLTASSSVVVLANQAQARNVFWIVGAGATLGAGSTFKGTVIANSAAVTVQNGISPTSLTAVEGRLYSGSTITVNEFAKVTAPTP